MHPVNVHIRSSNGSSCNDHGDFSRSTIPTTTTTTTDGANNGANDGANDEVLNVKEENAAPTTVKVAAVAMGVAMGAGDEEFGPYTLNKKYDPTLEEEPDYNYYCCSRCERHRSVSSGFVGICLRYALFAIFSLGISSFHLVVEWTAYNAIVRLPMVIANNELRAVAKLFYVFCIVGTVLLLLDMVVWLHGSYLKRRAFLDMRDGLRGHTRHLAELYERDVFVWIRIGVHELPLSCLLLKITTYKTCSAVTRGVPHLHPLQHHERGVILLAAIGAMLTAGWTLVWVSVSLCTMNRNAFTCLKCTRYLLVLLLVALTCIASLNFVLLMGGSLQLPATFRDHFDSLRVDHYTRTATIGLLTTTGGDDWRKCSELTLRSALLARERQRVVVWPCDAVTWSLIPLPAARGRCDVVLRLRSPPGGATVVSYSLRYRVQATSGCVSGRFVNDTLLRGINSTSVLLDPTIASSISDVTSPDVVTPSSPVNQSSSSSSNILPILCPPLGYRNSDICGGDGRYSLFLVEEDDDEWLNFDPCRSTTY